MTAANCPSWLLF